MRGAKVIIAGVAVIFIAVAGLVMFREPAAEMVLRQAMTARGLPNPQARVTELSVNHIRIENLSSKRTGATDGLFNLARVDVSFDWREAISARRVEKIEIDSGDIAMRVDETGAMEIAGIPIGAGDSGAGGLPFDALTISDVAVNASTPQGDATGSVTAHFDMESGGDAELRIAADSAGFRDVVFQNAELVAKTVFAADGALEGELRYAGDVHTPIGDVRNADFSVGGEGASWKELTTGAWRDFEGAAQISVRDVDVDTTQALSSEALDQLSTFLGGAVETLRVSGDLALVAEEGGIELRIGERPITIDAANGARLVADAAMGDPLFVHNEEQTEVAGVVSLRHENISATASINAQQTDAGWFFNLPVRIAALQLPAFSLNEMSAVFRGNMDAEAIIVDATANGAVSRAAIGRFSVADAPGALNVRGVYDRAQQRAEINIPADRCAALDRLSFSIAGQDMDASLKDARLCPDVAPLAVIRLGDNPVTEFSGAVSAKSGRYRLGGTRFVGEPPSIAVSGKYTPSENRTRARGEAKGGSVVLNDLLRFDRAEAILNFALDREAMKIDIDASRVRMTEYGATAKVAPIFASGALTLSGDIAQFNYKAFTENAAPLGAGAGVHNIKSAAGDAAFQFNRLTFAPGGLQPDRLAPVLKGIIGLTYGAATGAAQFDWDTRGIRSRAQLSFDDLTFGGPGLTVTKTIGVNGDIAFSSLWPVATDGAQAVSVDGVDFGALQLERGDIVFEMPGDDTLLVERAIFPWFSGEIGVRNAKATFTGGNALAALQVRSVDLKQILDYVDVEGLSGEGVLNGELPLVVENSRASFVGGRLTAEGPGRLSYVGNAGEAASQAGTDAQIAFDILRDLRYSSLGVTIDGPLDGRLDFQINFEGTGEVSLNRARGRVPVKYNIALEAALLDFFRQANLSRDVELQIRSAVEGAN